MTGLAQYLPITSPTMIFFVVLLIILFAPIVMGKLRIPHIIGMVLAGVAVGEYGFNILERDSSFELFGRVGLLYIMFLAGLEMDMQGLKQNLRQVGIFGLLTFCIPFVAIFAISIICLGYSVPTSFLLSCIMSSNTLVAYPIVARYGLQKHPTTTLAVGGSMISLLLSLIVIAAMVGYYGGKSDVWYFWPLFATKLVGYCALILYVIPRCTRWFLHRYSDSVMQFIFVLAMMFMSAALCEVIGLEGILGAFASGLILNRFIPTTAPLMNRLEFIGNALFIPYFLIGVGMLINIRLLFAGSTIITIVLFIVIVGTLGKALAAYISCFLYRLSWKEGHLAFGLTAAHAAGGIAIAMIGMRISNGHGGYLVDDNMLNSIVIMILFTCIISSVITESASKAIVLQDDKQGIDGDSNNNGDDEKILIPVKYPETCTTLMNIAFMMRNPSLNRGLVALNVVYDDDDAEYHQRQGRQLLDKLVRSAAAADVRLQTQVRLATNIGNGIKHAFKEYDCSEIILGLHNHDNSSRIFWGEFAQSVFNGLSRQIIIARCLQPMGTLRGMRIVVPSRAEYEPGFFRWLERLCRMGKALGCNMEFFATAETYRLMQLYISKKHATLRFDYHNMSKWVGLLDVMEETQEDQMLVVVTARQGTVSYKPALSRLPEELTEHYHGHNIMIIFPDQFGLPPDQFTFTGIEHKEQLSAYQEVLAWWRKLNRTKRTKQPK